MNDFKTLLKIGIGSRSITEFSNQCGLSREHVSRLVSGTADKPSEETLEKISMHIKNITLNDLREACGYEPVSPQETAKKVKEDLAKSLSSLLKGTSSNTAVLFYSLDNVLSLVSKDMKREGIMKVVSDKENKDERSERKALCEYKWKFPGYSCGTFFTLYYTPTTGGSVYVAKYDFFENGSDGYDNELSCSMIPYGKEGKMSKTQVFFKSLMNADGYYPATMIGFGFYYDETPENFFDFVCGHAQLFCTTKERSALYQRMVAGEDPNEVFKNFGGNFTMSSGTGAVISVILTELTHEPFEYARADERLEGSKGCVILPSDNLDEEDDISGAVAAHVYQTAKALGIREFGSIFHSYSAIFTRKYPYNTENFYISFHEE